MESKTLATGKTSRQQRRKNSPFLYSKIQEHTGRLLAALRQRLAGPLRPLPGRCLGEEAEG